jgi:hypothetical protein
MIFYTVTHTALFYWLLLYSHSHPTFRLAPFVQSLTLQFSICCFCCRTRLLHYSGLFFKPGDDARVMSPTRVLGSAVVSRMCVHTSSRCELFMFSHKREQRRPPLRTFPLRLLALRKSCIYLVLCI